MCWGFECPDEWFDVIWKLSETLQTIMERENIVIQASQVKEKYGGLRFYLDCIDCTDDVYNEIYKCIDDAEEQIRKLT
jgi:hypothetical protein